MVSLRFIVVSVMVGLVGCAAKAPDIFDKDASVSPVTAPISSELEQLKISFIARAMSRPQVRKKVEIDAVGASDQFIIAAGGVGLAGAMATDAAVGVVGSSAGAAVGGVAILGGLVFDVISDTTMKSASQIWLPGSFNGVDITSSEEATAAAAKYIDSRLKGIVDRNGWSLSCVYGCGGFNQIYEIKTMGTLSSKYQYRPETVMVYTNIGGFEEVVKSDLDRKVVGENIKWKTKLGNTAIVAFYSDEIRGEDGKVAMRTLENGDKSALFPRTKKALINVRLGRDLNRAFYADEFLFGATNETNEGIIFYNGKSYSAGSPSDERLATGIVNEENFLK